MGTIQPRMWSQQELTGLRQIIDGDNLFQSVTTEKPSDGLQDVLILTPDGGQLFKSTQIDVAQTLQSQGVAVRDSIEDVGVAARVSPEKLDELKNRGFRVVDDSPRNLLPGIPQTRSFPSQTWDIPQVDPVTMTGSDKMHKAGATGRGEVVAILDSGFDNPALASLVDKYSDFAEDKLEFHDGAGHGSHVLEDIHSTAPDARFVVGRVMGDSGAGRPSDILRGLKWIEGLKSEGLNINVVNMSLGGIPDGLPESFDAIDREVDKLAEMGVKVLAAAGNEGPGEHTIGSPADAFGALAVGSALNPTKVSDFSSRGPTDDGVEKPDFVAPGEFIVGTSPKYSEMYRTASAVQKLRDMNGTQLKGFIEDRPQLIGAFGLPQDLLSKPGAEVEALVKSSLPPTGLNKDGKVAAPGSSFAAPLAAGIVASLNSVKSLTSEETRDLLKSTADKIPGYSRIEQGAGFINAEKALARLQSAKVA